jgi:hypothetical protein
MTEWAEFWPVFEHRVEHLNDHALICGYASMVIVKGEALTRPGREDDALRSATFRNCQNEETAMRLTFIGKDPESNPTGSPTVYRTDRETWVVQGWMVTEPDALAQMNIPGGEAAVEIPDRMIQFFRQEGRDAGN